MNSHSSTLAYYLQTQRAQKSVSQIHEITLLSEIFQIARHGYRHLHLQPT